MAAERPPPAKPSLLAAPLNIATRVSLAYPAATVALAIALTVMSLVITWGKLGYRTSRMDLLDPKSDYNRLWIEYINEFGDEDDAVVVVEGAEPRAGRAGARRDLDASWRAKIGCFMPCCTGSIWARFARRACTTSRRRVARRRSVSRSARPDRRRQLVAVEPGARWPGGWISGWRWAAARRTPGMPPPDTKLGRLTDSLLETLSRRRQYHSPWPEMPQSFATLERTERRVPVDQRRHAGLRAAAAGAGQRRIRAATARPPTPCAS